MTITLNGESHALPEEAFPLLDLLRKLGFADRPVLVELNGLALRPREFPDTLLKEGDRIEMIQIVAGG